MTVLVIACHPDDEVLGCGGTIKHLSEMGNDVYVQILCRRTTNGKDDPELTELTRKQAVEKVKPLLGIREYFFGEAKDEYLGEEHFDETVKFMERVRDDIKPDLVFIHNGKDVNQDHQAAFRAAKIAYRLSVFNRPFNMLAYEVLSSTEQGTGFWPNFYIPLSERHIKQKALAMKQYYTEYKPFPFPRSEETIEALARFRGSSIGCRWAEAFQWVQGRIA